MGRSSAGGARSIRAESRTTSDYRVTLKNCYTAMATRRGQLACEQKWETEMVDQERQHMIRWRWVKADGTTGDWSDPAAAPLEAIKPGDQSTWYVPSPQSKDRPRAVQHGDPPETFPDGTVAVEIQLFHWRSSIPYAEVQELKATGKYPPPQEPINS